MPQFQKYWTFRQMMLFSRINQKYLENELS
ncbi:MAG: hypothetical protein RLZZ577_1198 [Bacteroidota bacterium]|jgi:hypothetical protein